MINTVRSPIRSLSNISLRRRQVVMSAGEPTINFDVAPGNIFIGSCLRVAEDGDKVKAEGVKVVVSLQDKIDVDNQKINVNAVESMLLERGVRHTQIPTSDADEQELQAKLPGAVALFAKEISSSAPEGVYIHCNGGRGRAPTVVAAYYFWVGGMTLTQAVDTVQAARASKPKVDVIRGATTDILSVSGTLTSVGADGLVEDGLSSEERASIETYLQEQTR